MSAARRLELVRATRGIRPAEPAAQRFNGQAKSGVWDQVFASPNKHTSRQYLMPDTSLVQAQQQWATENEAAKIGVGVAHAADRPSKRQLPADKDCNTYDLRQITAEIGVEAVILNSQGDHRTRPHDLPPPRPTPALLQ